MTIPAKNQTPDTAVRETANARAQRGTHLASDAASDALFVQRGTGTLGDTNGALDVQPGTGVVDGVEHTITSVKSVDIPPGSGNPRRDVVYLDASGALDVIQGTPDAFAWDEALSESERSIENAYRPAPPDMASTAGLALAVVTVPANATTLPSGAISELRAAAPTASGGGYDLTADMDAATARDIINSAAAGEEVTVEPGASWTLTSPLAPAAGVHLRANDSLASQPTFQKGFSGTLMRLADYCTLTGIRLHGNRDAGHGGDVLDLNGARNIDVTRCTIEEAAGDAVRASTFFASIESCLIRRCSGYGIRFPDTTEGEQPHNEIAGPTYIGYCDAGGIYLGDTPAGGKNMTIHAWIGHHGGAGIHATGTWKGLTIVAQLPNNDGPAWLQDGGNMRVQLDSMVVQNNATNPASGLTTPVGHIHIESGSLDAAMTQPFATNTPDFVTAPSAADSSLVLVPSQGATIEGDISGPNLALAVTDAAALSGSVDVGQLVALDTAAEAIETTGGREYVGVRSATPHTASGSGDVYTDDGTNTADGNPHKRIDDPTLTTSAWTDI